jgi:hypothetical protein
MKNIRIGVIVLSMLSCSVTFAAAQVNIGIGIGLPNLSIGINLPMYPELVPVPGYPVYYAPQVDANYFFYDSMYWVYQNDNWYTSSWYNGPWGIVEPTVVPLFILRIPVSYYRQPPLYFRGWQSNAPPRWGQHWGHGWEQRRSGWDNWKRSSVPVRAPLPAYQRQYSGDRYPRGEQQQALRSQSYRYQPRDKVVRQHIQQQVKQQHAPTPAQRGRQQESPVNNTRQQDPQRSMPHQQGAPPDSRSQSPQQRGGNAQRPVPAQAPPQQRGPAPHEQRQQPAAQQHEQQAPHSQAGGQKPQERGAAQEPNRGHGQEQRKDEERGGGRNN